MSTRHPAFRFHRVDAENGIVYGLRGKPAKRVTTCGYIQVLRSGTTCMAHRMIWESVHGPIRDGMEINHINGVKTDNRIANLELVTPSENCLHAYRAGLKSADGERNGRAVLSKDDVIAIRSSGESQGLLAKKYGVSRSTIHDVRAGKRWRNVA